MKHSTILRLLDSFWMNDIQFSCDEVAEKFIEIEQDIRCKRIVKEASLIHIVK